LSPQSYSFTVQDPLEGFNYYRLRQLDIDGKANYSKIVRIDRLPEETLIIYPNPATAILRIKIPESNVLLQILNSYGAVVKTNIRSGPGFTEITIQDLPAGIYYLKVLSNNKNQNRIVGKFIKR
jgi:hypothetical protein